MSRLKTDLEQILTYDSMTTIQRATTVELYNAVSKAVMSEIAPRWKKQERQKRAYYFSAEFLMGRAIYSNLYNLDLLGELKEIFEQQHLDFGMFEEIEDAALGNGGLGRLAACFLDSAATHDVPLDGYGIRYQYGLFKQCLKEGFQNETEDDWQRFGDPWAVRRDREKVKVTFADQTVYAVPYDTPIIGYHTDTVNTLRLWQSEALHPFDYGLFNKQAYDAAFAEKNRAACISSVLYPNDDTDEGKRLRLKQQYFFSSASLQDLLFKFKRDHGGDFARFPDYTVIQLNDTHPVISIVELVRLLIEQEKLPFEQAFDVARRTFAYTNHTILAEALEKWGIALFQSVLPNVYPYLEQINEKLIENLRAKGVPDSKLHQYSILQDGLVHMARLAIFMTFSVNGVAQIHTDLLKTTALKEWYEVDPDKFNNKTNGITQRRWLGLANPQLSGFITGHIGDGWLKDLTQLEHLEPIRQDAAVLEEFHRIKQEKKQELVQYIQQHEGILLSADFLFDTQVKRLHEYKRQLLNAFSILDIYFSLKDGTLTDFYPTVFLFGAKAAPGYYRAKGIIKFINEIARMVSEDEDVKNKLAVVFVQNYDVSYAEKLITAADVSEQISTAGTEASGTGNMKFMLNGTVTLGTYDGANVEIVQQAGIENNYIFGARVEEIVQMADFYDPKALYDQNPRIHRVVDTLVNGMFTDGGTGMFRELYDSLLFGASWHKADRYCLLHDFESYCDAKRRVNRDYADRQGFSRKCIENIIHAGTFSSDRTIEQYASEIWHI